jgi:hypothetical protein
MGCPYSEIFGKVRTGPHALRLFDLPVVDWFFTILGALAIYKYFGVPFELVLTVLLVLGILLHWLFGVPTSTLKYLGLTCPL